MTSSHLPSAADYTPSAAVPRDARMRLFDDDHLGMGNFLDRVRAVHPAPDQDFIWAVGRGQAPHRAERFSLDRLLRTRDAYAAWYHEAGVTKGDPVAVYLTDGFGNFLHYLALSALGAVPSLINGRMPAAVAADYVDRIGAVGAVASSELIAGLRNSGPAERRPAFLADAGDLPEHPSAELKLPDLFPYPHADPDPVMLCHTSGTTGAPKAAMFGHRQFFLGKRERLKDFPQAADGNRLLSALPQSHSAGISYLMTATLLGLPTMVMTDTDGASVHAAMEEFRPTVVTAFPQTYVDLAARDLTGPAGAQVHTWINTGDSAHEAHIRSLIRYGRRPEANGGSLPGSRFVDGLGSSEMGMALFRKVSEPGSEDYSRCVGTPIGIVDDVAILDEAGRPQGQGVAGRLGVRTPTVTAGYWNDSLKTAQSSFSGYWLTGDIAHRAEDGQIYHLDRVPDVIDTTDGPVYSLPIEEVVLTSPWVGDCAVIAVDDPESDRLVPFGVVRADHRSRTPADPLRELNTSLSEHGLAPLHGLAFAEAEEDLPTGPTGKILKRALRDRHRSALQGSAP